MQVEVMKPFSQLLNLFFENLDIPRALRKSRHPLTWQQTMMIRNRALDGGSQRKGWTTDHGGCLRSLANEQKCMTRSKVLGAGVSRCAEMGDDYFWGVG
jgi:hypothetical protein